MRDELLANIVSFEEDDAAMVLVFWASEEDGADYFMLQYPLKTDEQDRRLCTDGLYIERNDQAFGCYHGVDSIRRTGDRIAIDLTEEGRQRLRVSQIVIAPNHWSPTIDRGLARLAELVTGD